MNSQSQAKEILELYQGGALTKFLQYLSSKIEEEKENLITASTATVSQVQGKIKVLRECVFDLTPKPTAEESKGIY